MLGERRRSMLVGCLGRVEKGEGVRQSISCNGK